jgi:cellobiose-specific phosphotransferase system component IIB
MMAIEDIWSEILSQKEEKVDAACGLLAADELKYVLDHLQRMISEDGWHPAQIASAQYALNRLSQINKQQFQRNDE